VPRRMTRRCTVFLAIKAQGDAKLLLRTYPAVAHHFPVASYFVSRQLLAKSPAVVARFQKAMDRSLVYAQKHPGAVRSQLDKFTKIPPDVAQKVTLPAWGTDPEAGLLRRTARLSKTYGYLDTVPDVSSLVATR